MAPAWDVAAVTYGEAPALLDRALARVVARRAATAAAPTTAAPADRASLAAVVGEIGEHDDRLFFRAQAAVRRALLALAARLALDPPADVFFIPLDQVVALERGGPLDRAALARIAIDGRARREAQRALAMPLVVRDGHVLAPVRPRAADRWRGRGFGGVVRGRVLKADDLGRLAEPDGPAVVVARALTPPMVVALAGAVAVVSERGGLLGHAATIARELGVTCVVGCAGVYDGVADGDDLMIDGAAGLVVRLGGSPADPGT
jgi:phosphohistidine swiveling domain-containing protein